MQYPEIHHFHIPVMGIAFTIDSPIKVAKYGISSVISIVEDKLIEMMNLSDELISLETNKQILSDPIITMANLKIIPDDFNIQKNSINIRYLFDKLHHRVGTVIIFDVFKSQCGDFLFDKGLKIFFTPCF